MPPPRAVGLGTVESRSVAVVVAVPRALTVACGCVHNLPAVDLTRRLVVVLELMYRGSSLGDTRNPRRFPKSSEIPEI